MKTVVAILTALMFAGCDNYVAGTSTHEQMADVESGQQDYVIHPTPNELFAHSNNELATENLKEILLTDDLTPYSGFPLHRFRNIQKITLYCTSGTDQFLTAVAKLPKLSQLDLCETDATDKGIIEVSACKTLVGFGVSDWLGTNALNALSKIKTLKQINVGIGSAEQDLENLRKALPNCIIYEMD